MNNTHVNPKKDFHGEHDQEHQDQQAAVAGVRPGMAGAPLAARPGCPGPVSHQVFPGDPHPSLDRTRTIKTQHTPAQLTNCPHPVGFFIIHEGGTSYRIPAPCKSWDCPVCGVQKRLHLADRIHEGAVRLQNDPALLPDHRLLRFLTITQHTDDPLPIMQGWNYLRLLLSNHGYDNLRFFLVKEFTEKGKRHLHILINREIPHALLKQLWIQVTDGRSYIIDIRRVSEKINRPAAYMTKYLTKSQQCRQFKKYEKRFTSDRRTDWTAYTTWSKPTGKIEFIYCPTRASVSPDFITAMRCRSLPGIPDPPARSSIIPDDGSYISKMPEGIDCQVKS